MVAIVVQFVRGINDLLEDALCFRGCLPQQGQQEFIPAAAADKAALPGRFFQGLGQLL